MGCVVACQLNGFAPELVTGLLWNTSKVNGMFRFGWAEPFRFSRPVPFDRYSGTTSPLRPVPTVRYAVPNLRYVLLRYNFRFPILLYFKTVALESDFLILGRNDNVASSIYPKLHIWEDWNNQFQKEHNHL